MGWIKRNLIFVVSGCLALGLLGFAGFLIYQGISRNAQASDTLNDIYGKLQGLAQMQPQPGNDKIDNIKKAKEQELELRLWLTNAASHFNPIPPIPQDEVTSKTFATALGATCNQLQQEAKENGVGLPPQYFFSFQVQSSKLNISSGLAPLAEQLGEVKAISEILFAARVNNFDSIQRVKVSDDDVSGGVQSDYTDLRPSTNGLAVITPYVVTFKGFTPELARVLAGFASATNTFIVKNVSAQPAGVSASPDNAGAGLPPTDRYRMGGRFERPNELPNVEPNPQLVSGKGGLTTVLKEQLLRFTLEVDIVKLLPKS